MNRSARIHAIRPSWLAILALAAGMLAAALSSAASAAPGHAPAAAPPVAGAPVIAYAANAGSGDVSVLDLATLGELDRIAVGNGPGTLAVSPDASTAYVGLRNDDAVAVIDTATHSLVDTISAGIGSFPDGLALSPDGERLYVSNRFSASISVVDTASLGVVDTFAAISHPLSGSVTPDGARLYVPNWGDDSVQSIDTSSGASVRIPVGHRPVEARVSPDGAEVYVTNVDPGEVSVIDTASDTVVASFPVGSAFGVAFSPDGTSAYVPSAVGAPTYQGELVRIDTASRSPSGSVAIGALPNYVAADPAGETVLVPNRLDATVAVIDAASLTELGRIPVGATPLDVAYLGRPTICYELHDSPELGAPDLRFTRWAPAPGGTAEGLVDLRRQGDVMIAAMAGDPIPGIDVAVEQIPGGSMVQMLVVPSDDERPTYKGVTGSGAIVTTRYDTQSDALEVSVQRNGARVAEPVLLTAGGEMSPAEKITIVQVAVNHHSKHGIMTPGMAEAISTYLRRAQDDLARTPPRLSGVDRWLGFAQSVLRALDATTEAREPLPSYEMLIDDLQLIRDELGG